MEDRMGLFDGLSSQTHWRRFVTLFCRISSVSTFISRCGDRLTLMEDRMSLYDGLSSKIHWRRYVTHLCRTFPLYPHSYHDMVTDRLSWRMKWVYLMAYQAKLIEEGSDASLQNLSIVSTFIWKCGDWSTLMEDQMSLWLIKPNSLQKIHNSCLQNLSIVSIFLSKCGNQMRIKEDSTRKVNL